VEAVIALSIALLAVEIVGQLDGRVGLSARRPWTVSFCVGLLHGLGFAGALSEVGLPTSAVPLALASFNLGVEAGQLVFVVAVLALVLLLKRVLPRPLPRPLPLVGAYALGTVATFWAAERTVAFL
jgi:hypothetical protein